MKIVIFASGSGSTYLWLKQAEKEKRLEAEILALIVDRPCGAFEKAKAQSWPAHLVHYKESPASFNAKVLSILEGLNPDALFLCGFLRKVAPEIIRAYQGRIFNTHPSLLPQYGGHGLYGRKVHEAVWQAREKESGVSLHHVTENYDEGPLVAQARIKIEPQDQPVDIEEKVKNLEKYFLVEQMNLLSRQFNRS